MTPHDLDTALTLARTRRHFFRDCGVGLGAIALSSLLKHSAAAADKPPRKDPLVPRKPHFKPKASETPGNVIPTNYPSPGGAIDQPAPAK